MYSIQINVFVRAVSIVISGTDVDSSDTVMRCDNGNIAERSMCTLEPELIHKGGEFRIVAPVIHSIIITLAVYFNDIVDW